MEITNLIAGLPLGSTDQILIRLVHLLIILLFISGVTCLILQRLRFPYTIGLVIVGLLCSWLGDWWDLSLLPRVHLTENIILYVFLPALIFDAALTLDVPKILKNIVPILIMAVPGVVFATLAIGALVHYLTPLGWGSSMLFGALISATDPVAVIAIFKELKVPERLNLLVDGESLFNDATAIVMFGIIAGLVESGTTPGVSTVAWACLQFLWVFVGGFAIGCLMGWLFSLLIWLKGESQSMLGILFSICAAYASFVVAQGFLELSGVMATVGAGVVVASMNARHGRDKTTRQIQDFWPVITFFGNSLIFLFLGLTERFLLDQNLLFRAGPYMLIACLVVLVVRFMLVYGSAYITNALPGQEPISKPYMIVMSWGGLRGALPVGLAASISPAALGIADPAIAQSEQRLLVLCTVAVVVFTLLIQGVSIRPLMTKLGLIS